MSTHVVAQYSDALRTLTDTLTGTWSEQHKETNPGNIQRDHKDLKLFTNFLKMHNPFTVDANEELRNVVTGLIADSTVNVDDAVNVGKKIHAKLTGQSIGDVTLKRS